jgi:nitroimidazol reductase NimA-like FMN-containing flavoprotein (pyridoxamine 5'-phosphate oxidase superfamily)
MVIHELSSSECRDVLFRMHVGRLACARGNQPYIVPFSFAFSADEQRIYSFATHGQKIDWMRENPRVCVEVDDITDERHWTTLVIFGRYHEIDRAAPDSARQHALELFQQRADWWLPAIGKREHGVEHSEPILYWISIDQLSGRRADRPPPAVRVD